MKKFWMNSNTCTGCGACENICPRNAIKLVPNKCGFNIPIISESCIECGACEIVCNRVFRHESDNINEPVAYAAWSKDEEIRFHSTSGGIFSELAKVVLSEKGIVSGARYVENNMVQHTLIEKETDIKYIRQSKYIQSNIGLTYRDIKNCLLSGKIVAFCGSPCQVAALKSFLNKDYSNLYTIDFICRGMNSPKAYSSWLKEIEENAHANVTNVWFKYKKNGWKASPLTTRLEFETGEVKVLEGADNLYMVGYLSSNLYIRPCCGNCKFKGLPRQSDITLADFWGIDGDMDDDKGTSLVMINSSKGANIYSKLAGKIVSHQRDYDEINQGNVCFESSVHIPKKGKHFLSELDNEKFSVVLKKYTHHNIIDQLRNKIRQYIFK